jgi:hypothetical protein
MTNAIASAKSSLSTGFSFTTSAAGVAQIVFTSVPGATPTVSYTWKQENAYLLSRNKADLVIPESLPVTVDSNLFAPVTQDIIPLRVKQYSSNRRQERLRAHPRVERPRTGRCQLAGRRLTRAA